MTIAIGIASRLIDRVDIVEHGETWLVQIGIIAEDKCQLAVHIRFGVEHAVDLWVVVAVFGISQEYHFVGQGGAERRVGYRTVQGAGLGVKINLDAIPFAKLGLQTKVDVSEDVGSSRKQMPSLGI